MIEVKSLVKKYGSNLVVDDLSFTMEKGHIYGLLGPNGAGKSTTMNMMTGFLGATSGSVTIDGFEIFKDARKAKRLIGYLPEIPPVYPDMTVEEYLGFVCELKEMKGRKNRKEEVLRVARIADVESVFDRQISNLSKGYKQRVGFAQALIGNPMLIILDEPTVGLDPRQLQEFRRQVELLKEDHVVLISSHILAEVNELCDHIFILSKGKLIMSEDADQLSTKFEKVRKIHVLGIGDADSARMAITETIECVSDVITEDLDDHGQTRLTVEFTGEEDLRGQISQLLVENGFTILEMKEEEQSLEEVFLELTAGPEASDDETEDDSLNETEDDSNDDSENDTEDETEDDSKNDSKDDSEESVHTEKGDEK